MENTTDFYSLRQVSEILKTSYVHAVKKRQRGDFPGAFKVGAYWVVPKGDLEREEKYKNDYLTGTNRPNGEKRKALKALLRK